MRYFSRFFVLLLILSITVLTAEAQSVDANIKAAKKTATEQAIKVAATGIPDSVKWKLGGNTSLNFSQTWLSNWAAGGEPTISLNGNMTLFANYKKDKVFWENNAFLAYGIVKKGDFKAVKNDDQLNVGSRVGYEMAKNWYYSAVFLGKTQFARGYQYNKDDTIRISDFLAPAYLFLSLGLDYKPSSKFSIYMSPAMGKATLVRSDNPTIMKRAGLSDELIEKGKHARYEIGGGIVFSLNGDFLSKKITYTSQLELFSNYLESPENVDVTWDFNFRVALTRFISAGLRINMIYDDDQKTTKKVRNDEGNMVDAPAGAKLQVKEFFEIGFSYNF
ncbi:MAG: DUF3078 domain-containing protein [Bacteroidales bacterium]|nr:DUF3078 domain-containing protein [Bacteroidales bacterium]